MRALGRVATDRSWQWQCLGRGYLAPWVQCRVKTCGLMVTITHGHRSRGEESTLCWCRDSLLLQNLEQLKQALKIDPNGPHDVDKSLYKKGGNVGTWETEIVEAGVRCGMRVWELTTWRQWQHCVMRIRVQTHSHPIPGTLRSAVQCTLGQDEHLEGYCLFAEYLEVTWSLRLT